MNKQKGGAAIEYVLVSTFAMVLALASIGIVAKMSKDKLSQLTEKSGLSVDDAKLNPLQDFLGT